MRARPNLGHFRTFFQNPDLVNHQGTSALLAVAKFQATAHEPYFSGSMANPLMTRAWFSYRPPQFDR
jgi:hypothetical protein